MISLRDLGHTYVTGTGARVEALRGVTLDIAANSFVAIVGASGCGKSTMLRLLAGLERPAGGSLKIGGEEVTAPRQDIGIAFQAPTLLPWANVLKNVLFPLRLMRRLDSDADKRARDLLTLAGLDGFADKMPHELSGGMQQRVAICRALVHDPAILLLDEPFGALDALTREEMSLELLRIWSERPKTVFMVTHSINEAVLLADRVLVMSPRPGTLVDDVTIDLPRPRSFEMLERAATQAYATRIRNHIFGGRRAGAKAAE